MAAAQSAVDRLFAGLAFRFQYAFGRTLRQPGWFAAQVDSQIQRYRDAEPAALIGALRYRLRRDGLTVPLLAECFAFYSGALRAPLSRDVLAAARRLAQGGIVELHDPASRRHAIALAALACALHGDNVHLLAASDAAAKSLAAAIAPLFLRLGIRVACVARDTAAAARREAYAAPVVCAAHRELALDYLREGSQAGRPGMLRTTLERLSGTGAPPVLARLQYALVEDADLVMLDDAQAPVVIAAQADQSRERLMYEQALELARALAPETDYTVEEGSIRLTEPAARLLERLVAPLGGIWSARQRREELITWALEALHFVKRDIDYRVENGRVAFPPPADAAQEPGPDELEVRKLVEVKEGCRLSARAEVLARMSVPRFFGRYARVAGTCADARGLEHDFWSLYALRTARAGERPAIRTPACRVFLTSAAKRAAVVEHVRAGAAVIAVRSRAEAQALQAVLAEARLEATIAALPVLQDQEQVTEITVAELPAARRHIAQACVAYGASSCTLLLSLEDDAVGGGFAWIARLSAGPSGELSPRWSRWIAGAAQRAAERTQRLARQDLGARDRVLDDLLAVSGRGE
jgi:preprotein translocase subunit SecA